MSESILFNFMHVLTHFCLELSILYVCFISMDLKYMHGMTTISISILHLTLLTSVNNCLVSISFKSWYVSFHLILRRFILHAPPQYVLDPCRMLPPRSTYPSDYNCRSFYRCSNARNSVPMCCSALFRYDHRTMSCQPDSRCSIGCRERQIIVSEPSIRLSE